MNTSSENKSFSISLAFSAHEFAQNNHYKISQGKHRKQIYLNSLAVYAVQRYLSYLDFDCYLNKSDIANSLVSQFFNVADLEINQVGKIECRPVLPGAEVIYVPEEVWDERIAYIAVQLDESLRKATLLGFVETVTSTEITLNNLQSLKKLPEYLQKFQKTKAETNITQLSQWQSNVFDRGWEVLDSLLKPSSQPAFGFRNRADLEDSQLQMSQPEKSEEIITRVKKMNLQGIEKPVNLCIGLIAKASDTIDIFVKLYPISEEKYLPAFLQLMVLDEENKIAMQAETRCSESLEFQFSGQKGERFSISLILGKNVINEYFVI